MPIKSYTRKGTRYVEMKTNEGVIVLTWDEWKRVRARTINWRR